MTFLRDLSNETNRNRYGSRPASRSLHEFLLQKQRSSWKPGAPGLTMKTQLLYGLNPGWIATLVSVHEPSMRPEAVTIVPSLLQLEELATLDASWDGEGAETISRIAVAKSARLAAQARERFSVVPSFISPIPDGGLQIEWQTPISRLEVMVAPDGELAALLINTAEHLLRSTIEEHDVSDTRVMSLLGEMCSRWTGQWR